MTFDSWRIEQCGLLPDLVKAILRGTAPIDPLALPFRRATRPATTPAESAEDTFTDRWAYDQCKGLLAESDIEMLKRHAARTTADLAARIRPSGQP